MTRAWRRPDRVPITPPLALMDRELMLRSSVTPHLRPPHPPATLIPVHLNQRSGIRTAAIHARSAIPIGTPMAAALRRSVIPTGIQTAATHARWATPIGIPMAATHGKRGTPTGTRTAAARARSATPTGIPTAHPVRRFANRRRLHSPHLQLARLGNRELQPPRLVLSQPS